MDRPPLLDLLHVLAPVSCFFCIPAIKLFKRYKWLFFSNFDYSITKFFLRRKLFFSFDYNISNDYKFFRQSKRFLLQSHRRLYCCLWSRKHSSLSHLLQAKILTSRKQNCFCNSGSPHVECKNTGSSTT